MKKLNVLLVALCIGGVIQAQDEGEAKNEDNLVPNPSF